MNIQRGIPAAIFAYLWLLLSFDARSASPPAGGGKQFLTVPIQAGPPRSIQCDVPLDPAIPISAVAFSPDGKKLAAAGYREVVIWDLEKANLSRRIGSGQLGTTIGALAFLKGLLAVGEGTPQSSGAVRIFDIETAREVHVFDEPIDVVYSLAVSPDGKLLAAAGAESSARVWSVAERKLVATIQEQGDWVLGVSFSRDGKYLATASSAGGAGIWEVGTWKSAVRLPESEVLQGAAFGADAVTLALAVGGPSQWSLQFRRRNNVRYTRSISTGNGMPLDVIWTPKKNRIYVPLSDGTLRVFDPNGRLLARLAGHGDWVYCVAANPAETAVASGSADGTVRLWSAQDNRLLATLVQLSPGADEWLIITPQGYLAASSLEGLRWNGAGGNIPAEKLASIFQKPDQVREAIRGKKVAPPTLK